MKPSPGRKSPYAVVGACAVALLAIGFGVTRSWNRSSPAPAPRAANSGAPVEVLSDEEKHARELASQGIAAQPPDVQARYKVATAQANERVIATRRAALAALRDARAQVATEHAEPERLAAIDKQIRLSEEQLTRAESATQSQ